MRRPLEHWKISRRCKQLPEYKTRVIVLRTHKNICISLRVQNITQKYLYEHFNNREFYSHINIQNCPKEQRSLMFNMFFNSWLLHHSKDLSAQVWLIQPICSLQAPSTENSQNKRTSITDKFICLFKLTVKLQLPYNIPHGTPQERGF